jgi:hypothetical protein
MMSSSQKESIQRQASPRGQAQSAEFSPSSSVKASKMKSQMQSSLEVSPAYPDNYSYRLDRCSSSFPDTQTHLIAVAKYSDCHGSLFWRF